MKASFPYIIIYVFGLAGFFPILGQTTHYVIRDGVFNATTSIVASTALTSCPSSMTACNNTPVGPPGSFDSSTDSIQVCCNANIDVSADGNFQTFANITIEAGASLTTTRSITITNSLVVGGTLSVDTLGLTSEVRNGLTLPTGGAVNITAGILSVQNTLDNRGNITFSSDMAGMDFGSNLNMVTFDLGTVTNVANARIRIFGTGMFTLGFPAVFSGSIRDFRIQCTDCTFNQNGLLQTADFQIASSATNATYNVVSTNSSQGLDIEGDMQIQNGQFNLNGGRLTLGSDTMPVDFDPAGGTFNAGSGTIILNGNFIPTGGAFNSQTSTMRINASFGNKAIPIGNWTFHNLEIVNSGSDTRIFTCIPNQTISINNEFMLKGTSAGMLTFTNGGGTAQCIFNLMSSSRQNRNHFSFVTIQGINSNASSVKPIIFNSDAISSSVTDGGNNTGWFGNRLLPPSNLTAVVVNETNAELRWTPVTGITYDLYWSSAPGVTTETGMRISAPLPPYTHTGLNPGTTYYYILIASDGIQTSLPTGEVSVSIPSVGDRDGDRGGAPIDQLSLADIKVGPTIYRPSVSDFGINFMRLPKNTQIEIRNIKGSEVYRFVTNTQGDHRWNVRTTNGFSLGSGVYIAYFFYENQVRRIKFIVIR